VLALVVSVAHFVAAFLALRALIAASGRGAGSSVVLHVAVALLTFPLFYTPLPALLGGRSHTGLYVTALNALLWGAIAWALVRWRAGRARRTTIR
jgi:hypothetical protein